MIDDVPKGNLNYVKALTFAGFLVLLIAGLNYINLSLTQSTERSKEFILKKILDSSPKQLLLQHGIESLTMTLLVLMITGVLIITFDGVYYRYSGFHPADLTGNWFILMIILIITFVVGLFSTSFPGFYLSFTNALFNRKGTSVSPFKKVLLGFQFMVASGILIAALTMNRQLNFIRNKDLGLSKDQVLNIPLTDNEESESRKIYFRERVKNLALVRNASLIGGGALPGEENWKEIFQVTIDGNKVERIYNINRIDENYYNLLDIKSAYGRNFEATWESDKSDAVIINESLTKSLNWRNPIGKTVWYGAQPGKVVGVIRNFHYKSLHNIIEPIVFIEDESYFTNILIKTQTSDVNIFYTMWKEFFPISLSDYHILIS